MRIEPNEPFPETSELSGTFAPDILNVQSHVSTIVHSTEYNINVLDVQVQTDTGSVTGPSNTYTT